MANWQVIAASRFNADLFARLMLNLLSPGIGGTTLQRMALVAATLVVEAVDSAIKVTLAVGLWRVQLLLALQTHRSTLKCLRICTLACSRWQAVV